MKITRNTRKYGRVPVRGLLKYTSTPDAEKLQVMNIKEISEGGLSFLTEAKIESGTKLKISVLLLPQENPMDINAVVLRCPQIRKKPAAYQASLHFLDMSEKDRATLHDALILFSKSKKGLKSPRFVIRRHN